MGGIMYSSRYDTINLPANNKELMSTISSLVVDGHHKHVYNFIWVGSQKNLAALILCPQTISARDHLKQH